MLDTKRILQLGIGVAVGMLAYHFIQKAMNKGNATVSASGSPNRRIFSNPCTEASSPYWDRALCVRTGGIVNENSGQFGGCCY